MSTASRIRQATVFRAVSAVFAARGMLGDDGARLISPGGRANPYPLHHRLRSQGRLVSGSLGLMTAHHDICDTVLRDPERFGSAPIDPPDPGWIGRLFNAALGSSMTTTGVDYARPPDPLGPESMIGMDPPTHTRLRRSVSRAFTPRAVERLRPRVEEIAAELLDRAAEDDSFDLMSEYAGTLPVMVICELLGVPAEDRDKMKRWGDDVALLLDVVSPGDQERSEAALAGLQSYFTELFEQRRASGGDLIIDGLLNPRGEGDPIPERELMATALLLLVAGFETTVNLIGNGVQALIDHPEQRALLRDDPSLVPNAVEEILRWDPPVQQTGRTVRADTDFEGRSLKRGTLLLTLLAGANRDPEVFTEPDRFDVTRTNANRHLSFAAGVHHCLGASLARLEGEVALSTLLERYPDFRPAGSPTRSRGFVLRGYSSLPLDLGSPASSSARPADTSQQVS